MSLRPKYNALDVPPVIGGPEWHLFYLCEDAIGHSKTNRNFTPFHIYAEEASHKRRTYLADPLSLPDSEGFQTSLSSIKIYK